ncbi:hypothetical protein EV121DRAFT_213112, partial [Schizophyllum commune]
VGAGPTGLSLAISLLWNGVPVRIIDKAPEPRVGQKGFGIQASTPPPRTLEVLHLLGGGILDEVLERAFCIKNMLIYEMPGAVKVARELETAAKVPATPDKPWHNLTPSFHPDSRLLGHDRFEAILTRHLEAAGGKVQRGVELVGFTQDDDHVHVELRKTDGPIEHAQFDFLVGCDGGHSFVRRLLGLAFVGETRDVEWSLVADVVVRGLDSRSSRILRDYRAHRHRVWGGEVRVPNIRMVDRFGEGRVFYLDAAHTHSPAGGQGMNSGIQDGVSLWSSV